VFKNLLIQRLAALPAADAVQAEAALDAQCFVPCGASQPISLGWVPPRGQAHAPLLEVVGGHWLLRLMIEQKVLPGAVVKRRCDEMAARIEADTGRKPGKKQRKELKDQAMLELLPQAFTRQMALPVWIAPAQQLVMIDTASASKADEIVTLLTKGLPGLAIKPLHTALSPAAAMSDWLLGEPPAEFSVDRECELKSADEMKSVVRYARHPLDTDEVRAHIELGKRPTRLALTWKGRVSFVLTDAMQVKKLEFLDGVYEGQPKGSGDEAFDADAAIATGELIRLIPDLIDALGGEQQPGQVTDTVVPASTAPASTTVATSPAALAPLAESQPTSDDPPW
jgi:recombination associated protein RdgC